MYIIYVYDKNIYVQGIGVFNLFVFVFVNVNTKLSTVSEHTSMTWKIRFLDIIMMLQLSGGADYAGEVTGPTKSDFHLTAFLLIKMQ